MNSPGGMTYRRLSVRQKIRRTRKNTTTMKTRIEEFIERYLEDYTFEEILEMFDVTPVEAFEVLFDEGLIDEELLDRLL